MWFHYLAPLTLDYNPESESEVTQSCPTLCNAVDCSSPQAPLSMGFSRQEYWSGLPFPSPGDLSNPGIEPRSPALQAGSLTSERPGKPTTLKSGLINFFTSIHMWKCKYIIKEKCQGVLVLNLPTYNALWYFLSCSISLFKNTCNHQIASMAH